MDVSFCSSNLGHLSSWCVLDDSWGSDHYPTVTTYSNNIVLEALPEPKWNIARANWKDFSYTLSNIATFCPSVVDPLDTLSIAILEAANKFIPKQKVSNFVRKLPQWNNDCTKAINKRREAEKVMKKNKSFSDIFAFRKARAFAQLTLRKAKLDFWHSYVSGLSADSKLGSVWRCLKSLSGHSSCRSFPLKIDGKFLSSNFEKANVFAKQFAFISSDENLPPDFFTVRSSTAVSFMSSIGTETLPIPDLGSQALNLPFGMEELQSALLMSNQQSSPGIDNITMSMLFHLPMEAKFYLLSLFNYYWETCQIPSSWKHALINPIPKSNCNPNDADAYRPIAITSAYSKLLERMVSNRLSWYLEAYKLINPIQVGFRKNHSTLDHPMRLKADIENALSSEGITVGIFLDFSRAFDLVWIDGLLMKMAKLNINGLCLAFIKNFLINRTAEVVLKGDHSSKFWLDNGTPQGCVLSPLLFLIFINDFPSLSIATRSALFADDSGIWRSGLNINHIAHHLQEDLLIIEKWCREWGFLINAKKTQGVIFTRKRNVCTNLFINGIPITFSKTVVFLGFTFDSRLTWAPYIDQIVQRCKKRINLLKCLCHNKWGARREILLMVYRALIRSIIDYGAVLYQSASLSLLKKLCAIQCTALSLCVGAMKGTALSSLLQECNELPLFDRNTILSDKYLLKIHSLPLHVTRSILQPQVMPELNMKFPSRYSSHISSLLSDHGVAGLEGLSVSLTPPWTHVFVHVDTYLSILVKTVDNLSSIPFAITVRDYISLNYPTSTLIYTDGSVFEDKVGVAVYIPSLDISVAYRSVNGLSIHTAELEAVYTAISLIVQHGIIHPVILTDSLNTAKEFENVPMIFSRKLMQICRSLITNNNINLTICWIPGHKNIKDHDTADYLAKKALSNEVPLRSNLSHALLDVFDWVSSDVMTRWKNRIPLQTTGVAYHKTFPNGRPPSFSLLPRNKDTIITRLRLHNCFLNKYLLKIGLHQTGLCDLCNVSESVDHFLLSCIKHKELSYLLSGSASALGHMPSLQLFLSSEPYVSIIYNYVNSNFIKI